MRSIFLVGFMASGKSEVARVLARRLNMPYVDLDSFIEEQAGVSIASLFEDEGEAGFRQRERMAVATICQGEPSVIATGGGTACQPGLMEQMRASGQVVYLATELSTALRRIGNDKASRPLLAKPPREIERLYRKRLPVYRRASISVSTEDTHPDAVATDIERALGVWCRTADQSAEGAKHPRSAKQGALKTGANSFGTSFLESQLRSVGRPSCVVALGERSYPVYSACGSLEKLGDALRAHLPQAKRLGLISDDNVMPLYGESLQRALQAGGYEVVSATVAAGESSKSLAVFGDLADRMIAGGLDRSSVIIALGGGVVGDLAGYIAASLYRGIAVVQVPTTLLAMTDSAIGGKTGINSNLGKNLLGAFWQPTFVWTDPETLRTLPIRERQAAFGELVKYALLDDALWESVELLAPQLAAKELQVGPELSELVRACANLKASIVSTDERESGLRATLNLGHTVGHAIESHAGFGNVLHGEAVALGLLATCRLSHRLGLCDAHLESQVASVLNAAGLDTDLDSWLGPEVLAHIGVDKKRTGSGLRCIVLTKPGDVRCHELDLNELTSLLLND